MSKPTAVSLFSGCGGMDLGFEQAGFSVEVANDFWKPAEKTYRKNFSDTTFLSGDIRDITTEQIQNHVSKDVDVLIGGPPCQGFSRLNNNTIRLDEMEKDDRNNLSLEFIRVCKALKPEYFVMENVFDLVNRETSDGELVKDLIIDTFDTIGYNVEARVLRAEEYGVPQKRRRMFFVGSRDSYPEFPPKTAKKPSVQMTAGEALTDVTESLPNMTHRDTSEDTLEKIRHIPQGGYYKHLPDRLKTKEYPCECDDKSECEHTKQIVKRYGTYLRRLNNSEPSLTVSRNPLIHPTEDRYITPREKARLQTFPDDFVFVGNKVEVVKQIANAVPPELAEAIGTQVKKGLGREGVRW